MLKKSHILCVVFVVLPFLFLEMNYASAEDLPQNAHLNKYSSGWSCNKGFYRAGNDCLEVKIPANAKLNYYGNGWVCNKGFYRSINRCLKVEVPANAKLNYYGNGWICNQGYKKVGTSCIRMTAEEIHQQKIMQQAILLEMQRKQLEGVSGDTFEAESKTGANVCLTVTDTDFDCNKSYLGEYYSDCDVELHYKIETDYKGESSLNVDINCEVEIDYAGNQTYVTQSDSQSNGESHNLYADSEEKNSMKFNFSFLYFNEINKAKVSSLTCRIDNVDLW